MDSKKNEIIKQYSEHFSISQESLSEKDLDAIQFAESLTREMKQELELLKTSHAQLEFMLTSSQNHKPDVNHNIDKQIDYTEGL